MIIRVPAEKYSMVFIVYTFNCVGWEITFFNFLLSIKWKWEKSPLFQIILQKYSITLEFMDNNKTLDIRDNIQQSKSQ